MSFTKITQTELNQKGATTQPDRPTISAQDLKRVFDAPAKEVVAPAYNRLIDELEATTGAGNIGAVAPTGRTGATTQAVINSVSNDLATLEGSVAQVIADDHTHANKALLDTYTQTETDLADAVSKKHSHSNKSLLDTYTQTEANIADAVSKKHDHSNKSLLDTYTQTETNLADAVSKKHAHSNKALLDTYTQTESDLAQAVADDHTHSNKTVLDKFGESSGNPTYDGNPIGGGGSGDTFKNIVSAGTTFTASGEDTFKINAGSNVTITALSSPDKGIQISATGGGQSTGDMLMSEYDSQGDVKTAGGIDAYVGSEIGKLDVSDSAVSGQYVSAVSEADGKISVTRASLPTIPTKVSDLTNDSGYQTAGDVATAISGKADTSSLGDLAYIDIDGVSSTKVLQGDGTWINPPAGYDMIPVTNDIATVTALTDGDDDYVINAYTAKRWSNVDAITLYTTLQAGTDTIGAWNDNWKEETPLDRSGWMFHELLQGILTNDNVHYEITFDPLNEEVVVLNTWRVDDTYYAEVSNPSGNPSEQGFYELVGSTYVLTSDTTVQGGKTYYKLGGAVAMKFCYAPSVDVRVGIKLQILRTQVIPVEILP